MAFNILAIDDSSIVRKVLKKTLGMTSIDVGEFIEAENGLVALEKLKNSWIDIIFLDINMPKMNGVEFMQALQNDEQHKNLPVVVVSTEGSKERINELTNLGVTEYLRKPVTPEGIVEVVERLLGQQVRS